MSRPWTSRSLHFKLSPNLVLVSLDFVNKSSPDGFEWVHPTPCSWYIDSSKFKVTWCEELHGTRAWRMSKTASYLVSKQDLGPTIETMKTL